MQVRNHLHQKNYSQRRSQFYVPIYIQQDATLHGLFISGNCSTCFGWYPHLSSGAIQLYLQHVVFVTPLLLPAAIVEELEFQLLHDSGR